MQCENNSAANKPTNKLVMQSDDGVECTQLGRRGGNESNITELKAGRETTNGTKKREREKKADGQTCWQHAEETRTRAIVMDERAWAGKGEVRRMQQRAEESEKSRDQNNHQPNKSIRSKNKKPDHERERERERG